MAGKFKPDKILQLGLAHIEKVVLAGVGLFVVYLLIYQPFLGDSSKWSVFTTHPNDFQAKITEAENAHQSANWVNSKEKKLLIFDR